MTTEKPDKRITGEVESYICPDCKICTIYIYPKEIDTIVESTICSTRCPKCQRVMKFGGFYEKVTLITPKKPLLLRDEEWEQHLVSEGEDIPSKVGN